MANYGFRINVEGNAKAKIAEITTALDKLGIDAQIETEKVESAFSRMSTRVGESLNGIKSFFMTSAGLGAIFAGGELIMKSVEHYNSLQKATADLHQTMLSMNNAAGISEKELAGMAEELDHVTTTAKPAIIAAQGMLATFGNIKGDQFKQALQASADYAAKFFHGDMVEASKSLGIALDDPIRGMMRLHRTGVSFTEEQRTQIKNLQKAGHLMAAQQIILREIARETGGQAAAFAATDEGKLEMAKKQWDGVYETVGRIVNEIKIKMIPYVEKVVNMVQTALQWLERNKDMIMFIVRVLGGALIAFTSYKLLVEGITLATEAWKNAQLLLDGALEANPIGLIVVGIGALAGAFHHLTENIEDAKNANEKLKKSLGQYYTEANEETKKEIYAIADRYQQGIKGFNKQGGIIPYTKKEQQQHIAEDIKKQIELVKDQYGDLSKLNIDTRIKQFGLMNAQIQTLRDYQSVLKNRGKDEATGTGTGTGTAAGQSAINTSMLSGAAGGLGQAKVINIKIDKMQNIEHVNGGRELAEKGQNAVEVMVRTLNNIAYSQSGSQ